jgi:folate-binding protein YgfZ
MVPPIENSPPIQVNTSLISLSHLGLLRVGGVDAKKLLQGQLTCDLEEISASQSRLGAYCLPQGRMLSLFRIFHYGKDYYLQMPAEIVAETLTTLKKYAVFFKVKLSDARNELTRLSCSGASATTDLTATFGVVPEAVDSAVLIDNVLIIKLPGSHPHYELIAVPDALAAFAACAKTSENTWKYLNIRAGVADLHAATLGKLLPHEINLPAQNGVSFNKGCYTGQEIVARMHYRGQLKKHMYRGRVGSTPLPGADIYDENGRAGIIVDSCEESESSFQILFLADKNASESKQFYADFAKIVPIELMSPPV